MSNNIHNAVCTSDFNLRYTIESAQPLTFYSDFDGKGTLEFPYGTSLVRITSFGRTSSSVLKIEKVAGDTKFSISDMKNLFRLNDDMKSIYKQIASDEFLSNAISKYRGMRLTLNDPWITTLSFIVSQFNNIRRIRLIIKRMIERFGEDITDGGKVIGKSFPDIESIAHADVSEIAKCGAGFRSDYIKRSAQFCLENLDLYKLRGKSYATIKEQLMELRGVGDKVADCIALMGYGKLEAFPIDTWIKRTVESIYFNKRRQTIKEIHKFAEERWGRMAGYAQQYLYWHGMHYLR
ncbi:MAG: hypothetical protein QXR58_01440 [Candidatus Micrarchaeaceae archaeon]